VLDSLKKEISALPNRPGIYQYFDEEGTILYVGKAKKLKNRVSSYFNKSGTLNGKTRVLVKKIRSLQFVETATELDALLLENNLIKQFQPRYNILLKDDKTFPWICIKKEPFPRIFSTRNKIKDGSEYFGPYASVKLMKTLLDLASKLYPLRNCNYALTADNIEIGKFKVCLEYHLNNCLGPCQGHQSKENYDVGIKEIKKIIKGNISEVKNVLEEKMASASEDLDFEKAQQLKEKIFMLDKYQSKSVVVNPSIKNADVFNIQSDLKTAYVNYLSIIDGAVVQSYNTEIKKKLDEEDVDLLTIAVIEIREKFKSVAEEIIVPFELSSVFPDFSQHIPLRGDKKNLLDMGQRNIKYHILNQRKQEKVINPEARKNRILEQIKVDLRLQELPTHIECFDNSNFQGAQPVSACVVFRDAKPAKKEYRHFNIKTVVGPDDFASMEEVVQRRYSRLLKEGATLPQLIIIDGGKGQLGVAIDVMQEVGLSDILMIGIAKGEDRKPGLETMIFSDSGEMFNLPTDNVGLHLLQQIRDEAHRFAISGHRAKRGKARMQSSLEGIAGVGGKRRKALLTRFGGLDGVKSASMDELAEVDGVSKRLAQTIYEQLH